MGGLGLSGASAPPRAWWPAEATFAVDFVTGLAMRNRVICPLSEAMSFSRASTKFARAASGFWQSFAPNVPAITDLGISIEPERTNLVVANTANSGIGFVSTGTTRTDLAFGDSPAGDAFGKLVTQGGGATDALYFGLFNGLITAGSRHTVSASFKYSGSVRYLRLLLSDNVSEVSQCWLDLVDKTISNASPGATVRLIPLVDNWMHLELTTGAFASTTSNAQFGVVAVTGIGSPTRLGGSYRMWGGQVEQGAALATSPILTASGPTTRASDTIIFNLNTGPQRVTIVLSDGSAFDEFVPGGPYTPTGLSQHLIRRVSTAPI